MCFAVATIASPPSVGAGDAVYLFFLLTVVLEVPVLAALGTGVCRLSTQLCCMSQILAFGAEWDHDVVFDFHCPVSDEEPPLLCDVFS